MASSLPLKALGQGECASVHGVRGSCVFIDLHVALHLSQ